MVERYGYTQELHRSLSFGDLLVYGLVFMVPIAPFGIFGSVFQGSGGMVALAYAIGMVAMMFTALSYAQMSRAFPMAGSVYTYAGRGIAAPVGFLSGLDDPARLRPGAGPAVPHRRRRDELARPRGRRCGCGWSASWCSTRP